MKVSKKELQKTLKAIVQHLELLEKSSDNNDFVEYLEVDKIAVDANLEKYNGKERMIINIVSVLK